MDRVVSVPSSAGVKAGSPAQASRLPPLREELTIMAAATNADGSPAWLILDPVRNRFFRIGWLEFELLVHWSDSDANTLIKRVNQRTPLNVVADDIKRFLAFLVDNELLSVQSPDDLERIRLLAQRRKPPPLKWLLHNYLFFRVPLIRPQRWLLHTAPRLGWLFSQPVAVVVVLATLLGLYLASRQWDVFVHTFIDQMTWSGLLGFAVALAIAKALHELGHAFIATRHGVRVAHMGVAFLVMFPMLYTDTGESWKLRDARSRMAIASAGIVTELALAGLATLAWSLTPDGALRNGLFFLATTSWVMTLFINANPFMRFDGYFIFSDILDLPNLHERSGALAKTCLRRRLLGLSDPWPENFTPPRRRFLIGFALLTWTYRLVLFLGIALLIYAFFFKALGIFLAVVELLWFIGLPVWREVRLWIERRQEIAMSRRLIGSGLLVSMLVLAMIPLNSQVRAPGWIHAEQQQAVFAPFASRIVSIPEQTVFSAGDTLLVLDADLLSLDALRATEMAATRGRQLDSLLGVTGGEWQRQVLMASKALYEAEARASAEQLGRLEIRASFDGVLRDLDRELSPGQWIGPLHAIGTLIDPQRWVVEAFIDERQLQRLAVGQPTRARVLTDPPIWLSGHVDAIDLTRTVRLPTPALDAVHGGLFATLPGSNAAAEPRDALYRVRIMLDSQPELSSVSLVNVQISAEPEAVGARLLRAIAAVAVRESGF